MRPASLLGDNGYLGRVVMSKQSQHVLVTLPHPLLRLASLGLVAFIFTLFSLELSRYGAQLAPLWFPTSIMMVAFYRHAGKGFWNYVNTDSGNRAKVFTLRQNRCSH